MLLQLLLTASPSHACFDYPSMSRCRCLADSVCVLFFLYLLPPPSKC